MGAEDPNRGTEHTAVLVSEMEDPSPFMVIAAPLIGVPVGDDQSKNEGNYPICVEETSRHS